MNLDTKMIPRRILLTVMTILLLLSTFAYSNPDSTGTHKDTVAIQVLEERVKGNAEKTQNQVEALHKLIDEHNKAVNLRISDHDDATNERVKFTLTILGVILAFLTLVALYLGPKTVTGWIKQSISDKTDALIERHKTKLDAQAEKAHDEWAKLDKDREEYKSQKERMEKKSKEFSATMQPPAEPSEKPAEFQKKLEVVKDEADYTAKDWLYLGSEAFGRGHWKEAVKHYTNSIELDPNSYHGYAFRGVALGKLGLFKDSIKSLDEALELGPNQMASLLNAAEVNILLGHYREALSQSSKSLELSEDIDDKAASLYLKCIAEKLLGKDTSATEVEFERILKENFVCDWSFDEIERWLEDEKTDISEEAHKFIVAKTDKFKAKKKK